MKADGSFLLPAIAIYLGLFFLPLSWLLLESFRLYTPGGIGAAAGAPLTLANYAELLTPAFARFFLETMQISLLAPDGRPPRLPPRLLDHAQAFGSLAGDRGGLLRHAHVP